MRTVMLTLLLLLPLSARADGRGRALYARHCARCHVVGQGAAVADPPKSRVDLTLATRDHDRAWLMQFLQQPTSVNKDSACHAALDRDGARRVYRFLRLRLRPKPAHEAAALNGGKVPPASTMRVVQPPPPPPPPGLVRR